MLVYSLKYGGFSLLLYYNFDNFLKSMKCHPSKSKLLALAAEGKSVNNFQT